MESNGMQQLGPLAALAGVWGAIKAKMMRRCMIGVPNRIDSASGSRLSRLAQCPIMNRC